MTAHTVGEDQKRALPANTILIYCSNLTNMGSHSYLQFTHLATSLQHLAGFYSCWLRNFLLSKRDHFQDGLSQPDLPSGRDNGTANTAVIIKSTVGTSQILKQKSVFLGLIL